MRRKLTESYKELFHSEHKIIEIALKYGFQSHEVYTRAFRKTFGINPSEVALDKHSALFEAIDEQYLNFLAGLKVERIEQVVENCYFEVHSMYELKDQNSLLVVLSSENFQHRDCLISGCVLYDKSEYLSFALTKLKCKHRIYHTDSELSLRYYYNYIYQPEEMCSNYILLKKSDSHIDIIIPST